MKAVRHAAFAVILLSVPLWIGNPYYLHIVIMAGIFGVLALSLNLLLGYTGQLSLGTRRSSGSARTPPRS